MCGRFTLHDTPEEIIASLDGLDIDVDGAGLEPLEPCYNVAPTIYTPTVAGGETPTAGRRRWGLVPHWAKDPAIGNRMINARSETVAEKPAFRNLVAKKRCIVPANGYYEWKKHQAPGGGRSGKIPYYIRSPQHRVLWFAGLHDNWFSADDKRLDTYTIITTRPAAAVADIHHRMPVILPRDGIEQWLRPDRGDQAGALALLQPYNGELEAYAVSQMVNSPRNNSPLCMAPAAAAADADLLPGRSR
ncbi:MAG: SOS response-associated peptidase [Lentisphaeria bacterium]|jgi:putative SOS response-associated peptidase YedK|nr:SOS response-associated peptidase [Lentisphaeria bacterium]